MQKQLQQGPNRNRLASGPATCKRTGYRAHLPAVRLAVRLTMVFPLLAAALTGCVTSTVEQVRQGATSREAGDAVVLLGRRQNNGYETEAKFVECVGDKLHTTTLPVIPEDEFVDTLFPWFEPRVAPVNASGLNEMLAQPLIAKRLQDRRVRYLIWIDGSTSTTDSSGAMTCSASATGVACFGFLAWEKDSSYEATVWDVEEATSVGKISSDANGTSYIPAIVLPVPIIAPVQSSACSALASQIRSFLGNEDPEDGAVEEETTAL